MADFSMDNLIDVVGNALLRQFPDDISQVYYGDVGIYPPKAFQSNRGEQRRVVAIVPSSDILDEGRNPMAEIRILTVNVIVMVNMTPFFEAMPPEAIGERVMVQLVDKIRTFLAQDVAMTLGGNVLTSRVPSVQWDWMQRGNNAIRAAAIEFEVKVQVMRI